MALCVYNSKFGSFQAANYRLIGWKFVGDMLSLSSIVGKFLQSFFARIVIVR